MIRYIDPIWLYENVQEQAPQFAEMLKNLILVAPSIDICFCRECEYGEYRVDFDDYECHASGCGLVHDAEFHCADGERRKMKG